jgi:hypothetical protein
MRHSRTPDGRRCAAAACAVLLFALLAALIVVAPAVALSGRVAPPRSAATGSFAGHARGEVFFRGFFDAQSTGVLYASLQDATPQTSLTATDAAGAPVWSLSVGDVSVATGTLPAALVATFGDPDPNVLRDGDLSAYDASGKVTFHKSFKREFVQPLACSTRCLVWIETTRKAVSRVYVRQGGKVRSVALPYVPPKAHFLSPASASANGRAVLVGEYLPRAVNGSLLMTYWVRVSSAGVPQLVSHHVTQWVGAALTPRGDNAAVMTSQSIGGVGNLFVPFGKFTGPEFAGENAGEVYASNARIFEQGGYSYSNETLGWGTWSVNVFDRSLTPVYQRAWTFDDDSSSVWFSHDAGVKFLAAKTSAGVVTVMNTDTWATQVLPGDWAAVTPTSDGRLATLTNAGVFAYLPNPVADQ